MKAAILTSPQDVSKHPLEIGEVPQPEAKPGHVLLRVRACGVCRRGAEEEFRCDSTTFPRS